MDRRLKLIVIGLAVGGALAWLWLHQLPVMS